MSATHLHPKQFLFFVRDLYRSRWLIAQLTKKDFIERYVTSYLGFVWAFVHPLATLCVLWFVFQVGFKVQPVKNVPFVLWLMAGLIPWFFLSESLIGASNAIVERSYLIKKVVFRATILPLVKVLSNLLIQLCFIILLFAVYLYYGFPLRAYNLQVFYYLGASVALVLGIAWTTSALTVFARDVTQFLQVALQIGFWITPIFWELKLIPPRFHVYLKLNPVFYIAEGYRDAFVNEVWFWQHPYQTPYFWVVTLGLWALGTIVFKRLRPHFADVL